MAASEISVSETFSLMSLYKEFGGNTSMHGVGRALNNRNPFSRVVWSVIVVLGFAVAVFQFVTTMNDFYSYPVTTVVTLKQEAQERFPGITICNLNRRKKSLIGSDLLDVLSNFTETEASPYDTRLKALMQYGTMGVNYESGHQLHDMLIKCVFNRDLCSHNNFTSLFSATYGRCNIFETDPTPKYAARPGPQSGLILELNIEQHEYLPVTSKAGVKVIVHAPDEIPFPRDGGILAQPGAVTSVAVKKVVTRRLSWPYSNCVGKNGEGSSQPTLFINEKYTQTACRKSCYQLTLYERCQCCDADVPCKHNLEDRTNGIKREPNCTVPICNDSLSLECENKIEDLFLKGELGCDEKCPSPCEITTFETVVSTAKWPSDSYFDTFVQKVNETVLKNMTFTSRSSLERFVRSNVLRLELFLESLEVLELATQPKYDWNMLLGNVGGQLGLWLGFSLLTALELAELLMDTVCFCIRRWYKTKTTVRTQ